MDAPEPRLFLALWPAPQVQAGLARLLAGLPGGHGKAVHREDLHLTLVFLGEIGEASRACLERAMDGMQGRPFDLVIDQLGHWPRSQVLWCGPAVVPESLQGLVRDLQDRLQGCGFAPERRPYAAHVTLLRHARPQPGRPLIRPLTWPVRDFALVASTPGGPPPRYRVLRRWPLTGHPDP